MTDGEVGKLVRAVRDRVVRALQRRGKLPSAEGGGDCDGGAGVDDVQAELGAAAVQGRAAVGERAGERDVRVGRTGDAAPFVKSPLCASFDGFSLHAAVVVAARDRERLEKLCRYAGRPAIAESRLRELPDGRAAYSLKKPWRDGTTAVVMTKHVLMERLCALVPRPRRHPAMGRVVPRFCEREAAAFLRCGILAHGFARVYCDDCGKDEVVAFSCKGRGFCPSCGTRRMVDTAAFLVDRVIPEVAVRQWVLSLPYRVRVLCAYDADRCALVRRLLVRAVSGHYERAARRAGVMHPRAGAVAFVQRFDSGLRVNLHFHVLWLDGVYGWEAGKGPARFAAAAEVTDAEVGKLVRAVRDRVVRALRRRGKLPSAEGGGDWDGGEASVDDVQAELGAAAVQGRAAVGERAGERDVRVGRRGEAAPFVKGPLCASFDGFSLHAAVVVAARDRERLEKLCRYAGRPAIAESRLRELPDGRVAYSLKKRWRDGTTAVVMTKDVLMERLCALVPRPRRHLVTYHGVLGPAAGIRPQVVPAVVESGDDSCRHGRGGEERVDQGIGDEPGAGAAADRVLLQRRVPHAPGKRRRGRRRYSWAELLRRVFGIEVFVCPNCGGTRRLLAEIHDPDAIVRVLAAMGLPLAAPAMAAARPPPGEAELPG